MVLFTYTGLYTEFMSPEKNPLENNKPSQADLNSARDLIEENPLLRDNPRVQMLSDNDFVTENGRQLDPGDFIASMLDYIESGKNSGIVSLDDSIIEECMVVHSRRPDIEGLRDRLVG